MPLITRGQKIPLANSPSRLHAVSSLQAPGLTLDFSCFGVDASGKLSDDRYFVFYNQKEAPQGSIRLIGGCGFEIDLARLPASIQKLVFVVTIDGNGDMSRIGRSSFALLAGASEVVRFEFQGSDFKNEKAVMIAEIYRRDGWRLAAVGQGFAGGLSALLKHYGGQEIEESQSSIAAPEPNKFLPAVSHPPVVKNTDAVALKPQKVTLSKPDSTFKLNLSKSADAIIATARWIDNGDNRSNNDDLDLRAGILFPDGSMSIVTCITPGAFDKQPFVFHSGDVKKASRAQPGTEQIRVNSQIAEKYGGKIAIVFSVYSAIANGPVPIASLKPTMELQYGPHTIKCNMDFMRRKEAKKKCVYTYVIGTAIIDGTHITITPGGQVSPPTSEATPWLTWNEAGGIEVSFDGPAVLKGGAKIFQGLINAGNSKRYI